MSSKRQLYRVRFKKDGKAKTFLATAKNPHDAAKKVKSSGNVISVTRYRR